MPSRTSQNPALFKSLSIEELEQLYKVTPEEVEVLYSRDIVSQIPRNQQVDWVSYNNPRKDYGRDHSGFSDNFHQYYVRNICIEVLQFMWGRAWDDGALNIIEALRPSSVTVVDVDCPVDQIPMPNMWGVVVFLNADETIKNIIQWVRVGGFGFKCSANVEHYLRHDYEEAIVSLIMES